MGLPPTDQMDLYSLGTTPWFERNAKFGIEFIIPIGRQLAELERRLKKKSVDISSEDHGRAASFSDSNLTAGIGLTVSSTQVENIKRLRAPSLAALADELAELEVAPPSETQKIPVVVAHGISTRDSKTLSSTSGSNFASRMFNRVTPNIWADNNSRIRKTNIYKAVIKPDCGIPGALDTLSED
eukprot:Gregarina_sp_Poly_1__3020@NODE_1849_length_3212_cov_7_286169_g1200_i0_p1_GENE_NODE_1849_length_3212_cov_7_286169_g1200_i0NODE_1849_length_3212_cov_7_286169_g1200_i0_p1_ORF_typecomplete_len184_score12_15_NODE_1849_length_3212_cov_7_286169_g1200_i06261177